MDERLEERIRGAWGGQAGSALRLTAAAYGSVVAVRNLMYDSGVFAARPAALPVVSVGGLTAGGSGKTPIAADLAARLTEAGVRTAILTHGFADEMDVHRTLAPNTRVLGGRDRIGLARTAADEGDQIVVLDSGFQYRRLHRDLDVVAVDEASIGSSLARLPAGPFREGLAALARSDLVVVVRRIPRSGEASVDGYAVPAERGRMRLRELQERREAPPFVSARILPRALVAANESARAVDAPCPAVAVAGVMWPDLFFAQVGRFTDRAHETLSLRDHARIDESLGARLRSMAGSSGIVCTLKDSAKLVGALGNSLPIWYLAEEVVWEEPAAMPTLVRMSLGLLDLPRSDSNESRPG